MIPLRVEGADPTNPALDSFEQVALATVIAAAAGGSLAGQAISLDLFVNLATHQLPGAATAFFTGGFSTASLGGGTYVADSLATSVLAANCPRFCAADGTGRYFRLAAAGGTIAISQGGALGGANNDQPAVQAAIDYAAAIGARTLLFDFDTVSIWNTVRTSTAGQTSYAEWAQDGQSIWVTAPVKFLGLPTCTHIKLLSITGTSLETDWQNVGGNVWRGSGINLLGGPSGNDQTSYHMRYFAMEHIWLDGGCAYTGVRTDVTPASPDGPDLTNRGIRQQDTVIDNIMLTDCKISGFKGEAFYGGGTAQITLRKVEIWGSNQSAFNPSEGVVDAAECYFHDSVGGTESLGGVGGRWIACRIANTVQNNFTGGPANGLLYNYAYPTRDLTKGPPWFDLLSCDFQKAGQVIVGSFVRILDFTMTDSSFYLDTDQAGFGGNGSLTSCYIKGRYTIDQASAVPICAILGPSNLTTVIPGAPAGTFIQPPSDLHMAIDVHRTADAIANGRYAVPYSVQGYFDQNSCSLSVGIGDGVAFMLGASGNYGLPLLTLEGPTSSQMIGSGRPLGVYPTTITAGPYALTVTNPRHALLFTGTAVAIAITMAAPFTAPYGYAFGQKCRIYWDSGSTAGTTYTLARNGAGLRLNADCTLAVFGDWIEVEFNASTGLWHENGRSIHAA